MRGTRFLLPAMFAFALLVPAFAAEQPISASPRPLSVAETQFVEWINQERAAQGLPALILDPQLSAVAREHSSDMALRGYFSHLAPPPAGNTPLERFTKSMGELPSIMLGENIGYATQPVFQLIHEGLLDSPKHRANLLNPDFTKIGIGIYSSQDGQVWLTQTFTGPVVY